MELSKNPDSMEKEKTDAKKALLPRTPRASNKKFPEIRQTLKFLEEISGIQSLKRKIS